MMELVPVEGKKDLYRDINTNAIINKNNDEYENYLRQRESRLKKSEKINIIEKDLELLKNDINEIKFLLKKIVS
jgi:hypothetical protein